jgi:seryl-tRNA synthetase
MAALPKGSPEFIAKVQEMKAVSAQVKERSAAQGNRGEMAQAMLALPNLPHASVPGGPDAGAERRVRRRTATRRGLAARPPHWDIPGFEKLSILRAARR